MNTKSQSISLLLYVQNIEMTKSLNGSNFLQVLFGDKQWKGRQGGLNSSIHMCMFIFWQFLDFHTLQNKTPRTSKISSFLLHLHLH